MSKLLKVVCFAFLSLATSSLTFAWNGVGHHLIGNVAYQNLSPTVKSKVDYLINFMRAEYPAVKNMDALSQWPDSLFAQRLKIYAHWHYIDIPYSPSGRQENRNLVDSDNAVWALRSMTAIVKNEGANPYERARFLAFFIHIMGDIHQPLHTVAYVSNQFPEGDKGGNLYVVKKNNQSIKLHRLWDEACGAFDKVAAYDIDNFATKLMAMYPKSYFGSKLIEFNFDTWLKEGMSNAQELVYAIPYGKPVTVDYIERCKNMAQSSAVLAGYRIANLLNQLLA